VSRPFRDRFVVTRATDTASGETYAIESTSEKGGLTSFLTCYSTGGFTIRKARPLRQTDTKILIASDHGIAEDKGFTPDRSFDLAFVAVCISDRSDKPEFVSTAQRAWSAGRLVWTEWVIHPRSAIAFDKPSAFDEERALTNCDLAFSAHDHTNYTNYTKWIISSCVVRIFRGHNL